MRNQSTARPTARSSDTTRWKISRFPSRTSRHQSRVPQSGRGGIVRIPGVRDKNYTVTTRLRTFTFALTSGDRPFLGPARGPAQVARLARALIPQDGREHFGMFFLNNNLDVLGYHELAVGTLETALVSPREVYGAALRVLGTARIILVHNHPSGNPKPSRQDIALTKRLGKAGALLDIELTDHVIVGAPGHVSLVEEDVIAVS
jgi:hypothetical protein